MQPRALLAEMTCVPLAAALLAAGSAQGAPAPDSVQKRLLAKGHSGAAVGSLRTTTSYPGLGGIRHVRLVQRVDGLVVHGASVRAALAPDGALVHLIDDLADASGAVTPASVGPAAAIRAAGGGTASRVAIASGGRYAEGYEVQTWDADGLRISLVDGTGAVVSVENRTNDDSYNVFTEDPDKTPQTVVAGGAGWLGSGTQLSHHISGSNVNAYLDTDNDNAPDAGGVLVSDGNFLTSLDPAQEPSTEDNRAVSVQNLFFLNNVVHDILESHGFTDAAGNFEGVDAVQAEAQDGGGLDNANFTTPPDGTPPRMQMYLWTPILPSAAVETSAGTFLGAGAAFGPGPPEGGLTGDVAEAVPADGCATISSAVSGRIALIDRGTCDFVVKVRNAQRARAIGVIVVNNVDSKPFAMGGSGGGIKIPAAMISKADGAALRGLLPETVTVRVASFTAPMLDAALDSDIVYHEYGHGLTWRMIGAMNALLYSEKARDLPSVREGASDTLAMFITGDDRIAEYAGDDPVGIRSEPYDTYSRTFGDVAGTEIHLDGEVYAAIMWRLMKSYGDAGRSHLFDLWVDGMNYTPAGPSFEDMRNGMLMAADPAQAPANNTDECAIWTAFAAGGVGVGATHTTRGKLRITESFTVPSDC